MTTDIQNLRLDQIRTDGGTQPRVAIDEGVVGEYAELYANGVDLPPVVVFYDGATFWLADGFHRYWANRQIDCNQIFAEVRHGTKREAILYSVGANADHGLRRTNPDKRKAVLTVLEDEEWSQWSDREIARRCGVSHDMVNRARRSLSENDSEPTRRTYRTKHGSKTPMKTGTINRQRRRGPDSPNPVREARPAPAQTNLNLPHDPAYGARAIVSAMGPEYAQSLIESLTSYLRNQKEGAA